MKRAGKPPFVPRRRHGFEALMDIVVSQQLSIAAADTIFGRVKEKVVPFDPSTMLATAPETLRACGLSGPKQKHMKSIAGAILDGSLDLKRVRALHDDEARAHLTAIKGIGPWTADIYLMSSLGRADVWPVADVGLQAALTRVLGLRKRPNEKQMEKLSKTWRPWRTVVARLLWMHEDGDPSRKTRSRKARKSRTRHQSQEEEKRNECSTAHRTATSAGARASNASRRAVSWLWRRRQRSDRACAALAAAAADCRLRRAQCAGALRRRGPAISGFRFRGSIPPRCGAAWKARRRRSTHFSMPNSRVSIFRPIGSRWSGFSQGTMMSLHVGLRRAIKPAAIVGYSGMLGGANRRTLDADAPPVLLVHGDADPMIPVEACSRPRPRWAVPAPPCSGTSRRASATPSTRQGLPSAAHSWRWRFAGCLTARRRGNFLPVAD